MSSQQLFSSPVTNSSSLTESEKQKPEFAHQNSIYYSEGTLLQKEALKGNTEGFIGSLEVYIHHARDIHNVCIYHKQDVYAKLCLTSDPDMTLSTQIINGGGNNPVFNESLQLKVRTIDSSLKCEIWMLSRVKNYLQDQLLGFALVPLSVVLVGNGKLEEEYSLSSTDLFHSPAGFVQLTLSYTGSSPEVFAIQGPSPPPSQSDISVDLHMDNSLSLEYTKIEFPDPKIVNEDQIMVSEYIGIPCNDFESLSSETNITSENNNNPDSSIIVQVAENFSHDSTKNDTPPSSISAIESSESASVAVSIGSHSISETNDHDPSQKDKSTDAGEGEINSSSRSESSTFEQPIINIKIESEQQQVVHQDIVEMYMKSMQQFTESLAKMKLPLDVENGTAGSASDSSSSTPKLQQKGTGPRVFYGSRAFF